VRDTGKSEAKSKERNIQKINTKIKKNLEELKLYIVKRSVNIIALIKLWYFSRFSSKEVIWKILNSSNVRNEEAIFVPTGNIFNIIK